MNSANVNFLHHHQIILSHTVTRGAASFSYFYFWAAKYDFVFLLFSKKSKFIVFEPFLTATLINLIEVLGPIYQTLSIKSWP